MLTAHYSNEKYLTAKAADEKPTAGVADGTILIETDTGNAFFFDEETKQWLQV